MRRLSVQIYLTIIGSLLLLVILGSTASRFLPDGGGPRHALQLVGELIVPALPPAGAGANEQQAAVEHLYRAHRLDLTLYNRHRKKIASVGSPMPTLRAGDGTGSRLRGKGPPAWVVGLPDGRWIVVRTSTGNWHPALNLVVFLGGLAIAVSIGAYPVVRRLTRRLERLQTGVEMLGGGDLSARVKIEGRDEVARLAESFNRSAGRIEELVTAHRLLLANVSHELRTPLARIRVGAEFLKREFDPQRHAALETDIAELDRLIGQILMSSRLNVLNDELQRENVDLLALAAEEAARYQDCAVGGSVAMVSADPMMLRQLVRNLIENAERHGVPPVELQVSHAGGEVHLTVSDQGPGVPESDRDHIFEPFYRGGGSGGTGLGLALVRQIARRHGGEAEWYGAGELQSSIRVRLPEISE